MHTHSVNILPAAIPTSCDPGVGAPATDDPAVGIMMPSEILAVVRPFVRQESNTTFFEHKKIPVDRD